MSWWSDKEKFDEFDPPYCIDCSGGNSYEQCKRCQEEHDDEEDKVGEQNDIQRV